MLSLSLSGYEECDKSVSWDAPVTPEVMRGGEAWPEPHPVGSGALQAFGKSSLSKAGTGPRLCFLALIAELSPWGAERRQSRVWVGEGQPRVSPPVSLSQPCPARGLCSSWLAPCHPVSPLPSHPCSPGTQHSWHSGGCSQFLRNLEKGGRETPGKAGGREDESWHFSLEARQEINLSPPPSLPPFFSQITIFVFFLGLGNGFVPKMDHVPSFLADSS